MKIYFLVGAPWTIPQLCVGIGTVAFCLVADKIIDKCQDWSKKRKDND